MEDNPIVTYFEFENDETAYREVVEFARDRFPGQHFDVFRVTCPSKQDHEDTVQKFFGDVRPAMVIIDSYQTQQQAFGPVWMLSAAREVWARTVEDGEVMFRCVKFNTRPLYTASRSLHTN